MVTYIDIVNECLKPIIQTRYTLNSDFRFEKGDKLAINLQVPINASNSNNINKRIYYINTIVQDIVYKTDLDNNAIRYRTITVSVRSDEVEYIKDYIKKYSNS